MPDATETAARIICYRANKVRVWEDGTVHDGCPDDLNCKKTGSCQERQEILRCTNYYQTAREIIAASTL